MRAFEINHKRAWTCVLFTAIILGSPPAIAGLSPIFQDTGRISVSVDGEGNNNSQGGFIQVNKPAGATVRRAFLMANSHGVFGTRVINNGDVSLAGVPVAWDIGVFNGITGAPQFFHNVFADVTSIVASTVNASPPGIIEISVVEQDTHGINGTVLVVIFDDPNQGADNSVILLFGDQAPGGETFRVNLGRPITADTSRLDMGLGIGHSFQGQFGTPMVNLVDVNGQRLTSFAGGEDDGITQDGGLITVGGIGDQNSNPDPLTGSTGLRTDDELYDLRPFVSAGDLEIQVFSSNPTDDDNIFFSYFVTSIPAALVEAVVANPQVAIPCRSTRCMVPITCNLAQLPGALCTNRINLIARVRRGLLTNELENDKSVRALRRIRFASGVANVPAGQTINVRLRLTKRGREIARSGTRRLRGVMEISNVGGTAIAATPVRLRLRR